MWPHHAGCGSGCCFLLNLSPPNQPPFVQLSQSGMLDKRRRDRKVRRGGSVDSEAGRFEPQSEMSGRAANHQSNAQPLPSCFCLAITTGLLCLHSTGTMILIYTSFHTNFRACLIVRLFSPALCDGDCFRVRPCQLGEMDLSVTPAVGHLLLAKFSLPDISHDGL